MHEHARKSAGRASDARTVLSDSPVSLAPERNSLHCRVRLHYGDLQNPKLKKPRKPPRASGLKFLWHAKQLCGHLFFHGAAHSSISHLTPTSGKRSKLRRYANQEGHSAEFKQVSLREADVQEHRLGNVHVHRAAAEQREPTNVNGVP